MALNILGLILFIIFIQVQVEKGLVLVLSALCFLTVEASFVFYLVDAVLSIIKAIKKINSVFNIIIAIVIVKFIVQLIFCKQLSIELVIAYNSIIFLLEIISVIIHIKSMRDDRKRIFGLEK